MDKKTHGEQLVEELFINRKNGGERLDDKKIEAAHAYCERYKTYLDASKTEREAVTETIRQLEAAGYKPFETGVPYKAGDKVYQNNRGKALIAAVVGTKPLSEGVHIVASHIDSPRIDLKPQPLYEEAQIAYFKTHYYGGIKKYQWAALPLALHGVIVRGDGTTLELRVGEEPGEPVLMITDLLPHLANQQGKRLMGEVIKGEELNIVVGTLPHRDEKVPERVKLNIMKLLHDKYGIHESDLITAELSCVPVQNAQDVGFDRNIVGAYGHDDRVCAYTSITAQLENPNPAFTSVVVLADKEETGSNGPTGLDGAYLKYFIADLAEPHGIKARHVLSRSKCLSADVNAAFDPTFADVHEKRNAAYINYGGVLTKYVGARGKSGTNDASAEYMAYVRSLLDAADVVWQTGEMGKVDEGGGGTVAGLISRLDVDTVDYGVPVLCMHAPFEMVSKIDVYETHRAFSAFLAASK